MSSEPVSLNDLNNRVKALQMAVETLLMTTAMNTQNPEGLLRGYADNVSPGKTIDQIGINEGTRDILHKMYTHCADILASHVRPQA